MKKLTVKLFIICAFISLQSCEHIMDQAEEKRAQENFTSEFMGKWTGTYSGDLSGSLTSECCQRCFRGSDKKCKWWNGFLLDQSYRVFFQYDSKIASGLYYLWKSAEQKRNVGNGKCKRNVESY